jgi:hypothetical protein
MNKQTRYYLSFLKRKGALAVLAGGILLGILLIGLVRFVATPDHHTHYHANFAVFIHGQRQEFKGPQYYQEIAACSAHDSPLGRTHMHDENNHVVHVHDDVVTWSDFFTNLGWSLGNSVLYDGHAVYTDGLNGHLSFILNGKPTRSIANEIIGDQDRLLVSFGNDDDAALKAQFSQVQSDAKQADESADPSTCQGPEATDSWTRLREAFLW